MFGISSFTAVVNPPQACILAVGAGISRIAPPKHAGDSYILHTLGWCILHCTLLHSTLLYCTFLLSSHFTRYRRQSPCSDYRNRAAERWQESGRRSTGRSVPSSIQVLFQQPEATVPLRSMRGWVITSFTILIGCEHGVYALTIHGVRLY